MDQNKTKTADLFVCIQSNVLLSHAFETISMKEFTHGFHWMQVHLGQYAGLTWGELAFAAYDCGCKQTM